MDGNKTELTALAAFGVLAASAFAGSAVAGSAVIGQVTTQGTATIGSGVTAIDVSNSVHPYFSGESIAVKDDAEIVLRLTDDGALKAIAGTTLRAEANDSRVDAVAEGNGVIFQFKAGTSFKVQLGCYTVTSTGSVDSTDGWVAGKIGANYVESASGEFNVSASGNDADTLSAGMRTEDCGAVAVADSAQPTVTESTHKVAARGDQDSMSWIWGSAGVALAAVAGGNASSAAGQNSVGGAAADNTAPASGGSVLVTPASSNSSLPATPSGASTSSKSGSSSTQTPVATVTAPQPAAPQPVAPSQPQPVPGQVDPGNSGGSSNNPAQGGQTVVANVPAVGTGSGSSAASGGSGKAPVNLPSPTAAAATGGAKGVVDPVSPAASPTTGK